MYGAEQRDLYGNRFRPYQPLPEECYPPGATELPCVASDAAPSISDSSPGGTDP